MAHRPPRDASSGEAPAAAFPPIDLPIAPPYPPMEAVTAARLPPAGDWLYEPKWDGFRCLAFKRNADVLLQSKSGQPLGRYFPEIVSAVAALDAPSLVLDGEIVIAAGGHLDFDALLQRIHPAESRIRRLARETPASLLVFDMLVDPHGADLTAMPLAERRARLEALAPIVAASPSIRLSPATPAREEAERWIRGGAAGGLDGVVAKIAGSRYRSGERDGMVKVKRVRTADCVVGGFRYAQKGNEIGSLLLGLYDDEGKLDHVGFTASFSREARRALAPVVLPLRGGRGFDGRAPGGPSRWSAGRSTEWEPLDPTLVCEVRFDHFSGGRFRHGTKFLRWRPDKAPRACTFDQMRPPRSSRGVDALLALAEHRRCAD